MEKDRAMDESKKEYSEGMDLEYLMEGMQKKEELGNAYIVPLAGHMGQFFGVMARIVVDKLGKEQGETVLKEAVEGFGRERGKRIAETVKAQGKPLTLRNFLIYGDMDSSEVISNVTPGIQDGDLTLEIRNCNFSECADRWGLREYAQYYCKYIDVAILEGYNPELKLEISKTLSAGDDACYFRYKVKGQS